MRDFLLSPVGLLMIYLVIINLIAFLTFGADKRRARRDRRRVRESTLFLLAAIGGSVGALLGMRVWHHKTLHKTFRFGIPAILILQILIPFGLYLYWNVIR